MKVEGEMPCPICKSMRKCFAFEIRSAQAILSFECPKCHIRFTCISIEFKISKGKVEFTKILSPSRIEWSKREFNPSER